MPNSFQFVELYLLANNQSLPSFGDHIHVQRLWENMEDKESNQTHSENPRNTSLLHINSSEIDEFYYHTDVRIDFKRKLWLWNSTNEVVKPNAWDSIDYFQFFPYMQDAVALNIYADKVLYRIFVSFFMIK